VVYVTHDQSEALTMSDRIAVFNDGIIQQLATPADLYERPQNAFVAQFIGENNRLIGEVKSIDGEKCTVDVGGEVIVGLNVNSGGVGAKTTLSLRPERVVLNPETGALPNVFDATVLELIYLGDHVRCRVGVCGNNQFIVKVPNAQGHGAVKKGDDVSVGWQAEDCRALDA
jgi:putative spermidine/putrescine transport system ATP-binding protein